jgi:hypothetical protein
MQSPIVGGVNPHTIYVPFTVISALSSTVVGGLASQYGESRQGHKTSQSLLADG